MEPQKHANTMGLYVPSSDVGRKSKSWNGIVKGSAIVGDAFPIMVSEGEASTPRLKVFFEGDIYGAHKGEFYSMIRSAAGRYVQDAPTIAKAWFDARLMAKVGYVHCNELGGVERVQITDQEKLDEWRGQT